MWEKYYSNLKVLPNWLMQPAPFVVEALLTLRDYRAKSVLDLGCGTGRHCFLLTKNNFESIGVDLSPTALRISNKLGKREQRNVKLACATMTYLPFRDFTFDAVISVSVIHHALKRDIAKTLHEIHRVLKKEGLFLANLASIKDPRYRTGKRVEDGTFRILETFTNAEELHHFFKKQEILELLDTFTQTGAEQSDEAPYYWIIQAKK